jgi:4-hydroxybenzoate polyprenyltransferase
MTAAANLWSWSQERFPPSQGIFVAMIFATGVLYGQFLSNSDSLVLDLGDIVGFGACWAVFLMLRIFDEHKDYAQDLHNYPDRVLQSGGITLGHLKVLGLLAIALQAGYSLVCDQGVGIVTFYWLLVFGWSLLMAAEFFVPRWLNSHLAVYGSSHMLVMPLIMAWLMRIGASGSSLTTSAWWLALLAFFAGCTYELTRKAWGAEEERDTVASYARLFGTSGVAITITTTLGVAVVASVAMVLAIIPSTPGWIWYAAPISGWLLVIVTVFKYAQLPTIKARKNNETMVGLGMLITYATPLMAMIVYRGINWTL